MDVKDTSVEAGDNRRGGADRVRERAARAGCAGDGHAAGGSGLGGLGGQGQRPAGGAAGQGRVRRGDARGAGGRKSAGRRRDPGECPGQQRPATRRAGRTGTGPRRGQGGCGRAARADRPDPGRAADLAAGPGLAAQGRCRGRDPRARGSTALGADLLDELRQRYDEAAAFGITHNRLRDWHEGNHPGYALGCWLRDYKEQVFLFTRDFAADWTTNVAERGAKSAKRHQAVSGYWHSLATLARWCRIRSYLDSAAAHGITALDAIRDALTGKPWLPPLPAIR
jgi:hypothetical protein